MNSVGLPFKCKPKDADLLSHTKTEINEPGFIHGSVLPTVIHRVFKEELC